MQAAALKCMVTEVSYVTSLPPVVIPLFVDGPCRERELPQCAGRRADSYAVDRHTDIRTAAIYGEAYAHAHAHAQRDAGGGRPGRVDAAHRRRGLLVTRAQR